MANPGSEEYGGFLARVFAFICDQLIASALYYLIVALMFQVGFVSPVVMVLLAFVVSPVYFAAMQSSAGQATIGKSLLGLKVATVGGERASFARNLGREFGKIVSGIPLGIGFLMPLFTGRKQALHDLIASTVVLDAGPARVLKGAGVTALAFVANGAIIVFMIGDAYNKMMAQLTGGMMAEMQGGPGGLPPGMTPMPPRSAPKVVVVTPAPKVVTTPAPQAVAAAPKPAPEAPKAAAAPMTVAVAAQSPKPAPAMTPRAAPAPKPAAAPQPAETPPAETQAPLPANMPARVASTPAAPASSTPAAPASPAAAVPPPPAERPGVPGPKYNDLMTAVLYRDVEGVNELLAFGKWVDKGDSHGVTPLMMAVRNGDAASAEALLKAGADPNRNAVGGESAMKIAVVRRDAAMTALLERYAKPK
jgi:uncharacterized RDD family membrane protein YckC/outer membrane biosynthesis protein TonB